ncbi:hypothetical protein C0J52_07217 [Blattella germanica]|nr:hypothetical protein C0J52_07217 [Blattella germanica]
MTGEALLEWRRRHAENARRRRRAAVLQEQMRLQQRVNRTLSLQQYPKEIPFRCGICPRNFNNRWQLSQHRNRSHRQDNGQYVCDVCGKTTGKVRDMVLHKRGRHNMAFPGNFPTIEDITKNTLDMEKNFHFVAPPYHPTLHSTSLQNKLNSSELLSNSFQQSNFTNYLARFDSQNMKKYLPNQSHTNSDSNSTSVNRNELTGSSYKTLTDYIKQNETTTYDTRFDSSIGYQPIHHFENIVDQGSGPFDKQEVFNRNYPTFISSDSFQISHGNDQGYKFPSHILQQNNISNENTMFESEYLTHAGISQSFKWEQNQYMTQLNQASNISFSGTGVATNLKSREKMKIFPSDFSKNFINQSSEVDDGESYGLKIVSVESQQDEILNSDSKTFSILQPSQDKSVMGKVMSNKFTENWKEFENKVTTIMESGEEKQGTIFAGLNPNFSGTRRIANETNQLNLKNISDIGKTKEQFPNEERKSQLFKTEGEQELVESEKNQYNQTVSHLETASVFATNNTSRFPSSKLSNYGVKDSELCPQNMETKRQSSILPYHFEIHTEGTLTKNNELVAHTQRKTINNETSLKDKGNGIRDNVKSKENGKCKGYNLEEDEIQTSHNNHLKTVPILYERKDIIDNSKENQNAIQENKYTNTVSLQTNVLPDSFKLQLDAAHRVQWNFPKLTNNKNNSEVTTPEVTSVTIVENRQNKTLHYPSSYQKRSEQIYNMQEHNNQNITPSNSVKYEHKISQNIHVEGKENAGFSNINSEKVMPNRITYSEGNQVSKKVEQHFDNQGKYAVEYGKKIEEKSPLCNLIKKTEECLIPKESTVTNKVTAANDSNECSPTKGNERKENVMIEDRYFSERSGPLVNVKKNNTLPDNKHGDVPTIEGDVSTKYSDPTEVMKTNRFSKLETQLNYKTCNKIFYRRDENNTHGLMGQIMSQDRPIKETLASNTAKEVFHCNEFKRQIKKYEGNSPKLIYKTVGQGGSCNFHSENNSGSVLKEISSNDLANQTTPLARKTTTESVEDNVSNKEGKPMESLKRPCSDMKTSFPQHIPTKYESILVQNENKIPKIKIRNIFGKLPTNQVYYKNLKLNKSDVLDVSPHTKISLVTESANACDQKELSKDLNKEEEININKCDIQIDSHNSKEVFNIAHQMKETAIKPDCGEPSVPTNTLKEDNSLKNMNNSTGISVSYNQKKEVTTPHVEGAESEITTIFQMVKEVVEPTGTFVYVCLPCELILRTPEEYDTHQESQHRPTSNKVDGKRMDIQLKKTSNDKHSRLKHRDTDGEKKRKTSREKNHECDVCGRKFVFGHLLQDHMNTHTGDTPYSCIVCGTRLSMRSELMCHVKLHRQPYTATQ